LKELCQRNRLEVFDQQEQEEQNNVVAAQNPEDDEPENGFKVPFELRFFHERELMERP
jgi:hypothetical protein